MTKLRLALYSLFAAVVVLIVVSFTYNRFIVGYWSPPDHVESGTISNTGMRYRDPVTKTGALHGWSERYYPDGQIQSRTLFINGQWGGESLSYLEDGSLNIQVTDFNIFKRVIRRQNDGTYQTEYSLY